MFVIRVLSYLPAADTEKETEDIRLLLLLKLFDVFEGTHLNEMTISVSVHEKLTKQQQCGNAFTERGYSGAL